MEYSGLIPEGLELYVLASAIFMSLLMFLILYLVFGYNEQENQVMTELEDACKGKGDLDPERVKKVSKVNIVYKWAIVFGTVLGALITYGLMATWVGNFIIDYFHGNAGFFTYIFGTMGVAIGVSMGLDVVIHAIADQTFEKIWAKSRNKLYETTKTMLMNGNILPNVSCTQEALVEALDIGIGKTTSTKDTKD